MKTCPICNAKFFDDMTVCEKCNMQLIDDSILKEIRRNSINRKMLKKYPEECQIILEYNNKQNKEYEALQRKAQQQRVEKKRIEKETHIPTCPICHSTSLSKITIAHKVSKIALFGIFGMGDNGKTWKCNNCGSKF